MIRICRFLCNSLVLLLFAVLVCTCDEARFIFVAVMVLQSLVFSLLVCLRTGSDVRWCGQAGYHDNSPAAADDDVFARVCKSLLSVSLSSERCRHSNQTTLSLSLPVTHSHTHTHTYTFRCFHGYYVKRSGCCWEAGVCVCVAHCADWLTSRDVRHSALNSWSQVREAQFGVSVIKKHHKLSRGAQWRLLKMFHFL